MSIIDLIIFFIFTGGIVLLGCSFFKPSKSSHDFTNAGRSLPSWVVGMSIFSTYVSSISYLGYPGKAFASDWNPFVFSLSIPISSYFAAKYFVPFYRNYCSVSAYAFLEERFGLWARLYASTCYLLTQVARMGSILFLLALPLNILLGWDLYYVILFTCFAVIAYSMFGGIRVVIWTEAIQGIILIGGALLCLGIIICSIPGGVSQFMDVAIADNKFSLGSFDLTDWSTSTFWVCLIYGIFINLQNFGIDQNYIQRYHTAKSDEEAKHAALFGGYLFLPMSAVFFLIGTALYVFYVANADKLPAEGIKSDYVFPYFIVNELPVGIKGILIASIFSAGMSTVATSVTSSATIVMTDFYSRFRPNVSEREKLISLKVTSLIFGLLGAVVALALVGVDSILDAWWKLSSILSGGMLGLFLLGYMSRKTSRLAAIIAVLCGFVVIAWISVASWMPTDGFRFHEYMAIVLGTIAIVVVGFTICNVAEKS